MLVFAPAFEPAVRAGGPARSITNLVLSASKLHDIIVVAPDRDFGASEPFPGLSGRKVTRGRATIYYVDVSSPLQWASLLGWLSGQAFDLILLNSLWHQKLSLFPAILSGVRRLSGHVVLMPRGELEPGAMALKSRKKRLAGPAFRCVYRRTISAVGSTSLHEAGVLAEWFPGVPVLMSSNIPDVIAPGSPSERSAALRVLFLGRIHPTKGLLELLQGLAGVRAKINVAAHGPVESEEYWARCLGAAKILPQNVCFTYSGTARRDEITQVLWNSDCVVLLTAGENYGHVIAEALQAGCPVITTPTTPWTDVIASGGGSIVLDRADPTQVANALDSWASKTPEELADARDSARRAFDRATPAFGPSIIDLALETLCRKKRDRAADVAGEDPSQGGR